MTITARNYAAQVAASLRRQATGLRKIAKTENQIGDVGRLAAMATNIEGAIHFAVPDGGKIFDDQLRGIVGATIRLPFPAITVAVFLPNGGSIGTVGTVGYKKRMVFCQESFSEIYGMAGISFVSFSFDEQAGEWSSTPVYLFMPSDAEIPNQKENQAGGYSMHGACAIWLPEIYRAAYHADPSKGHVVKEAEHDIMVDVPFALELLEALSCANVTHEPLERIDTRKNAKRIKAGKLPIYETRILTIEAGKSTAAGTGQGGSHASPRQHLRRGHIRRLPDKNIWVNACVVGKAETGVINKQYHVKAA